jgi:hypothetical protein
VGGSWRSAGGAVGEDKRMCGISVWNLWKLWKGCEPTLYHGVKSPSAYNACDDQRVSQDRLRAQVRCEDESNVKVPSTRVISCMSACCSLRPTQCITRFHGKRSSVFTLAPTLSLHALSMRRVADSVQKCKISCNTACGVAFAA